VKIRRLNEQTQEITIAIKQVQHGEVFRFQNDSYEDALKSGMFWMMLKTPELKERVRMVNLEDGSVMERDPDHRVVVHTAVIQIKGN
jgi:hypothetical protein